MKKFIYLFAAVALMLAGCGDEPNGNEIKVTDVTVQSTLILEIGKTATLKATIVPEEASNKEVSWNSDDDTIAAVDAASGEVTGIAVGSTTITVTTTDGGHKATCTVTVKEEVVGVTGVSVQPTLALEVGKTYTLRATVTPADADNKEVSWSSDDTTIATVDPVSGEVTGVAVGSTTITVTTVEGEFEAGCVVTVSEGTVADIRPFITDPIFLAYCQNKLENAYKLNVWDIEQRKYVEQNFPAWDTDEDGLLSGSEAAAVTHIAISSGPDNPLTSLAGIEHFTGLVSLECDNNMQLTELDLSSNTELVYLKCMTTGLTSLDVSECTSLKWLDCSLCSALPSIDISNNLELINLNCAGCSLTELNIENNTALTDIMCYSNKIATPMDVSHLTELMILDCASNMIPSIDIHGTKVHYLWCDQNPGDGQSKLPVKAWFDNRSIPSGNVPGTGLLYTFTGTSAWGFTIDGTMKWISVEYTNVAN